MNNTLPMSPPMRPSFVSEESYCAPWDLKTQEEKLKLLNEQHQLSSLTEAEPSNTNPSFHRTYSVRTSSKHRIPSPSVLPSFSCRRRTTNHSPGNKNSDPTFKRISSCFNSHTSTRSGTATSRSFLFASIPSPPPPPLLQQKPSPIVAKDDTQPMSFETTSLRYKYLSTSIHNNSLPKTSTVYDQPWDLSQASFLNRHCRGRSLQKLPNTEDIKHLCLPPTFPIGSSHHLSEDMTTIPVECYFWYHYAMSRRQAEDVLQSRPIGSFLVRQSESGNQHDYSLSIRTTKGSMHMRICYSDGFYILGECSRPFSSVACVIDYFTQTLVPIRGAPHIKLGTPVLRCELSSSSISNEELL